MIRVIFLGPPGSGKGTQARLIALKYNIINISAGKILRKLFTNENLILHNTSARNSISVMNTGNLVDDKLVTDLIISRIHQNDCANGFLLDGFPRTIVQAKAICQHDITIDFVIEFDVPDFIIVDRITGRQIHIPSGRVYHAKFNPPKTDGLDDFTGEKLTIRKDDNKKIIQQRLNQYYQYTKPISDYYKNLQQKKLYYFLVDGNRDISKIYAELINIFNEYAPSE